jgi:uncharacterized membrane protein
MWTRKDLKARAKLTLKGHYWTALVATLVLGFANGGSGGSSLSARFEEEFLAGQSPEYVAGFWVGMIVVALVSLAVAIFVGGPLEVGVRRYFTSACCRQYDLGSLGFGFKQGRYWNTLKTQLLRAVETFLWSLLLVVPGIIKSFEYAMIPYILADDPEISCKEAFAKSKELMKGNKWRLFKLELSFIGWAVLCVVTFGVGAFFLAPYLNAATAEFYAELKNNQN